jgi:hypothetical protein
MAGHFCVRLSNIKPNESSYTQADERRERAPLISIAGMRTLLQRAFGDNMIGGSVGPRAGLDKVIREEFPPGI